MDSQAEDKTAFAPAAFAVGRKLASHVGLAILSCRYPKHGWTQLARFKTLVGYAPGQQRDMEVEMAKAVSGAVAMVENKPLTGFKLVAQRHSSRGEAIASWTAEARAANECAAFLVEDPRGFAVAVEPSSFYLLLEASGGCLDGYAFRCEAAYVWDSASSCPRLVPASSETWKRAWAESRAAEEAEAKRVWLKPSQLATGKFYVAAKPGQDRGAEAEPTGCFYLGRLPVYTHLARSMAIRAGRWLSHSELADARAFLLRAVYGEKKAMAASREKTASFGDSYVFSEAVPAGSSHGWQQPKFWTAKSTAGLFPEDFQSLTSQDGLEPAVRSFGSGCFKRYEVSREAISGARWKRLADVEQLAASIKASHVVAVAGYMDWEAKSDPALRAELADCRQALDSIWPMLPGMALTRGYHVGYVSHAQTQVFKTKHGFGPLVVRKERGRWIGMFYKPSLSHGGFSSYGYTAKSAMSAGLAWTIEEASIQELAEAAIAELGLEIPELSFGDGQPVPDSEAMWFAAEVADVAGLAKASWLVPVRT